MARKVYWVDNSDFKPGEGYGVSEVVEDEAGHTPVRDGAGERLRVAASGDWDEASKAQAQLNATIGVSEADANLVVISSMFPVPDTAELVVTVKLTVDVPAWRTEYGQANKHEAKTDARSLVPRMVLGALDAHPWFAAVEGIVGYEVRDDGGAVVVPE